MGRMERVEDRGELKLAQGRGRMTVFTGRAGIQENDTPRIRTNTLPGSGSRSLYNRGLGNLKHTDHAMM